MTKSARPFGLLTLLMSWVYVAAPTNSGCDTEPPHQTKDAAESVDTVSDVDTGDIEDTSDSDDVGDSQQDASDACDVQDTNIFVEGCDCVGTECPPDIAPTARMVVLQNGQAAATPLETQPMTLVEFDASSSEGPNGASTQLEYNWRFVSCPIGSRQTFLPNETVDKPRLFLDMAGEYVVELQVRTTDGTACRELTQATITPQDEVYAELIFETPADDPADEDGTTVTTYATLRVYLEGTLAAEVEDVALDREEAFYRAGFIEGSTLEWEETGRLHDGFPNN